MDIEKLYKNFISAGQQSCSRGDHHRRTKMHQYRTAKQKLFDALKDDYFDGKLCSVLADKLVQEISESTKNPEHFWGSAKIADMNQLLFVYEKSELLFEELLRCWTLDQSACDVYHYYPNVAQK